MPAARQCPALAPRAVAGDLWPAVSSNLPKLPFAHRIKLENLANKGVVNIGPWMTQTKNFAGNDATAGYLAPKKLAVAVMTTYTTGSPRQDGRLCRYGPRDLHQYRQSPGAEQYRRPGTLDGKGSQRCHRRRASAAHRKAILRPLEPSFGGIMLSDDDFRRLSGVTP